MSIEEHAPLARWNDARARQRAGEVFVADYNGELPQFDGPDGSAAAGGGALSRVGEALAPLALTLDGDPALAARRLAARPRAATAEPLAIELGREEPAARLATLRRRVRTHDRRARARRNRVEHVDLRYRNGFAARVPGFRGTRGEKDSRRSKREKRTG